MSDWVDVEKEDISLSDDGSEVHFFYAQDKFGNKYVSAKTKDILDIIVQIKPKEGRSAV